MLPKKFSNKVALWFIGTVLCTVKHPVYGEHQLTEEQLKRSPGPYKNELFQALKKAYEDDPVMIRCKIKELE